MPALPGYHPVDSAIPEARAPSRLAEAERRLDTIERPTPIIGKWYQSTTYTGVDGQWIWDTEVYNTDPSVYSRVTNASAANAGLKVARPGFYRVDAGVLLGGNLTAGTRYDFAGRVNGASHHNQLATTPIANGYVSFTWNQVLRLAAGDIISMATPMTGATRFGDVNGNYTWAELSFLG